MTEAIPKSVSPATADTAAASQRIDEVLTMSNVDDNANTTSAVCHIVLKQPPVIPEDTIAKGSCRIDEIATVFSEKILREKNFPPCS